MNTFFYIVKCIDSCKLPAQLEPCKRMILNYKEPKGQELLFHKLQEKLDSLE